MAIDTKAGKRTIPKGLFVGGGEVPSRPAAASRPIVPLEWIISHPATFPWISAGERSGVGAAYITDPVIALDAGFEGVITFIKLIGNSDNWQADNFGIQWALLVNRSSVFRSAFLFLTGGVVQQGFFADLGASNGAGDTWADVRVWLEEGATVQFTYINNGGPVNTMGWLCRGYAWPLSIREDWVRRGWRK